MLVSKSDLGSEGGIAWLAEFKRRSDSCTDVERQDRSVASIDCNAVRAE